jgi:SSS family solute:Na+ symporter
MNHLPTLDLAVIVVYFVAVVGLGLWLGRRSTTTDEFMAAGRSLPGWAVGLSMFGSYISSLSFLANAGKAYDKNWNAFVFTLMTPVAAAIAVYWLVPFYRSTGHVSAYEHLEHRFGPWARAYTVVCFLLLQMARTGAIIYLLALAISPLLGWNVLTTILVTGAIMTVYTILGGIVAVVWTGVLQSAVLIAGTLTCLVAVIVKTPGGLSEIIRAGAAEGKFGLGTFGDSAIATNAEPTFWVVLAYGILMNLANFAIDQSYIQRYITARDDREAQKSVWLTTSLYVPAAAIFFFIGTALFVFYGKQPDLLGPVSKADEVFPFFIAHELPIGMAGLVIAALFAASMDSNLNSMATLTYCDFYQRYLRPRASEREAIIVLRLATLAWGAVCTAVGVALMVRAQSALDAWWQLAGLFSAGMLGLFWLGFLSRRATSPDAAVAVVVGMVVIVWATLSPTKYWPQQWQAVRNSMHSLSTVVVVVLVILTVGVAAGSLRRLWERTRNSV